MLPKPAPQVLDRVVRHVPVPLQCTETLRSRPSYFQSCLSQVPSAFTTISTLPTGRPLLPSGRPWVIGPGHSWPRPAAAFTSPQRLVPVVPRFSPPVPRRVLRLAALRGSNTRPHPYAAAAPLTTPAHPSNQGSLPVVFYRFRCWIWNHQTPTTKRQQRRAVYLGMFGFVPTHSFREALRRPFPDSTAIPGTDSSRPAGHRRPSSRSSTPN